MVDQHEFYVSSMKGTAEKENEIAENKRLVEKYPWLWPGDWNWNKIPEDEYDYTWTVLDEFPAGWKKAFGEKMCAEFLPILKKYNYVNKFRIVQLKEKYGSLRCYTNGMPRGCFEEINAVISKYEDVSEKTCGQCGKPAEWISRGYIFPYCHECADKSLKYYREHYPDRKWIVEEMFDPINDGGENDK